MPAHDDNNNDPFQTLDMNNMEQVTGGASSDMSSMMLPMMMMMMMRGHNQAAPAPVQQTLPQFTINGAPQQGTMGADGSWNFVSNGDY